MVHQVFVLNQVWLRLFFVLLILALLHLYKEEKITKLFLIIYITICIVCILLTKSATGVLFLMVIASLYTLFSFDIRQRLLLLVCGIGLFYCLTRIDLIEVTRAGAVLKLALENPSMIFRLDSSLAERAAAFRLVCMV